MFNLSLFKSTTSFACKEFKKRFWFWQVLNLKIMGMIFVLTAAYVVAALLGVGLVSLIVVPQSETVHFEGFWDVWHWIVQYCVSFSTGLRLALAALLIMAIIAAFFVYFYKLLSYVYIGIANTLDVAHDKKPRDLKPIKQVIPFGLLSIVAACFGSCDMLMVPPANKIALFTILSLFFTTRFYFSFFVVLDKSTSTFQALCKSWKITQGHMKTLLPVAIFVHLPNILAWLISHKHIEIAGLWAIILWLIWWIVTAFFMLVMARAYTTLNRA